MNEHARKAWKQLRQTLPCARESLVTSVFHAIWRARGEADKGVVTNAIVPRGHLAKDNAAIKAIAALDEPLKE